MPDSDTKLPIALGYRPVDVARLEPLPLLTRVVFWGVLALVAVVAAMVGLLFALLLSRRVAG